VVKRAKERAERDWVEREGGKLGDSGIKKVLEEKIAGSRGRTGWEGFVPWRWRLPRWEGVVDTVIDGIIEC